MDGDLIVIASDGDCTVLDESNFSFLEMQQEDGLKIHYFKMER